MTSRRSSAVQAAPEPQTLEIKLAHSPDADDAFMFYALATNKIRIPGLRFTHVLADIETLNQAAREEFYDVTAVSFYGYAFLADRYALLDCGASFGEGYGPLIIASHPLRPEELAGRRIAVPGMLTTAYLALKLFEPRVEPVPMAFDKILDAVKNEVIEAGVLIHEGQLLVTQNGLHRVADLGHWWLQQTGLPLPLGGNAVRRALGPDVARQVARAIQQSVTYAMDHREAALNYAGQFARDMDPDLTDKFVGMYVNKWTLGCGDTGRRAIRELYARGARAGLVPSSIAENPLEFIGTGN